MAFVFIPPDELFAFTPRLAIGTGRSAVIDDATIVGPGECPAVTEIVFGFALIGAVKILSRDERRNRSNSHMRWSRRALDRYTT